VRVRLLFQPADWDNEPAQIPDPDASKPDDWNEEDDGEWEAPLIDNPKYKGEWKAPMIDNPAFKGVWKARQIDNPKYTEAVAVYDNIGAVGFEVCSLCVCPLAHAAHSLCAHAPSLQLWIVNSGTVFDNILVTDSEAEAKAHADKHWKAITEGEKDAKEAFDKKKKEAEEAAKPKAAEPEDDEDDDEL
jgi:calreticulin